MPYDGMRFFTVGKQHKARELDVIMKSHTADIHDMITRDLECPALISKIHCTLSANQKRDSKLNE